MPKDENADQDQAHHRRQENAPGLQVQEQVATRRRDQGAMAANHLVDMLVQPGPFQPRRAAQCASQIIEANRNNIAERYISRHRRLLWLAAHESGERNRETNRNCRSCVVDQSRPSVADLEGAKARDQPIAGGQGQRRKEGAEPERD